VSAGTLRHDPPRRRAHHFSQIAGTGVVPETWPIPAIHTASRAAAKITHRLASARLKSGEIVLTVETVVCWSMISLIQTA